MKSGVLDLHPQGLLPAVPVLDQQVLLCHKGGSPLLHLQQVGESLKNQQMKIQKTRYSGGLTKPQTSNLRFLVVHGGDGNVEGEPGDGATVLVGHRKDKLDKERVDTDVLHGRHEGHFHVAHCMLGEQRTLLSSTI